MQTEQITQYARALYRARGDRAEGIAARRQAEADAAKDPKQAETWRRIRQTVRELRGARVN